ncbi:hypothetical protein HGP16_12860 [Rhizobium sp. P40RR-XXII]|uniref:hypothetical protein n=1 Tax=unclassified Rhizobium TaxID=2613769 RepID=UPI00145753CC|nr:MULTISPECIES: hypothetical protein [unclassified Rhizobium]NLR86776.1 hypothetical protein [Rhizobium sp. P28RR-XV]NLS17447.1 hypothetical protein [Rhizobium sp. P40RR-XXII]
MEYIALNLADLLWSRRTFSSGSVIEPAAGGMGMTHEWRRRIYKAAAVRIMSIRPSFPSLFSFMAFE